MTQKLKIIIIVILIIILLNNIQIKYEKFIYTDNENTKLPTVTFKSYKNCPILRNLYFGLSELRGSDYVQNENADGMKFRSLIQSTFYNVDEPVEVDLPLINLIVEKNPTISDNESLPNFIFKCHDGEESIKYIDDNYLEFDEKEAVFGVKENFEIEDIMRYLNYCFYECGNDNIIIKDTRDRDIKNPNTTNNFKKMVPMKYMTLTSSHLWALRCHACKNDPDEDQHFYILPERIRYMAEKQGKKYTRAKCTNCHRNIIVYFYDDAVPNFLDDESTYANDPNLNNVNLI
jgi:hypothetical protein